MYYHRALSSIQSTKVPQREKLAQRSNTAAIETPRFSTKPALAQSFDILAWWADKDYLKTLLL
jgi:hypothetical protein